VMVTDSAPERAVPQAGPLAVDTSPPTSEERSGGLGLALASAIASSWGVSYGPTAKAVWFRIEDDPGGQSSWESPQVRRGTTRQARPAARSGRPRLLDRTVEHAAAALGGDAADVALATSDETMWDVRSAVGLTAGGAPWRPLRIRTEEICPSSAPEPGPVINDDLMIART